VRLDSWPFADLARSGIAPDRISLLEGENALGRRSIFAFAPLKQGQWFLCFQQEAGEAFADYRQTLELAIAVFLIAAVGAVLLSYLVSRHLAVRLAELDRRRTIMDEKVIEAGRLASIGELAAGIAHEINNPVAIMVEEAGWIDDLLRDANPCSPENLGEIGRSALQIRAQGERCKEITYKLLSFARKTDPTVREVDVNAIVEEVVGLLGQKARYANVRTEVDLGADLPAVSASPSELQQVLLNLVNNAVDAIGHRGGTVTITTRADADGVVLRVSDTGEGIPEANLPRIFDPFFTTKPVGQGTGLGLSICYGIVDKLGGRITVDSEVERGTTFTVYLPARGADDEQPSGSSEVREREREGDKGEGG
jgi:two-component system NtrC family sensor kinase